MLSPHGGDPSEREKSQQRDRAAFSVRPFRASREPPDFQLVLPLLPVETRRGMANSIYILFSMDEFVTEQELKMSIAYLIKDTPYDIIDFDYSSKYFGNVIIILTNHEAHNTFRFISDRGDVHVEQEFNGYWLDKCFHPRIENDKIYLTLLNAIADFLK